jgi:hypothetical protein
MFETCPMCRLVWPSREVFLSDPQLIVVGYQADLDALETGLFLFNHRERGCGTTLAVEAGRFVDLATGPIYRESLEGTEECPDHCLRPDDLRPCPAHCECAYVRDVLQVVRSWKKLIAL